VEVAIVILFRNAFGSAVALVLVMAMLPGAPAIAASDAGDPSRRNVGGTPRSPAIARSLEAAALDGDGIGIQFELDEQDLARPQDVAPRPFPAEPRARERSATRARPQAGVRPAAKQNRPRATSRKAHSQGGRRPSDPGAVRSAPRSTLDRKTPVPAPRPERALPPPPRRTAPQRPGVGQSSAAPAPPAGEADEPDDAPEILTGPEADRVRAAVERALAPVAAREDGRPAAVDVGEIARGKVDGRTVVACETARVDLAGCRLQDVPVRDGSLRIERLAFDHDDLVAGRARAVGSPVVVPDLVLDQRLVMGMLTRLKVKNPGIAYEPGALVLTGRVSYFLFSIPFRMAGRLELTDNNIGFRVRSLSIRGSPATPDRVQQVQSKLAGLIRLDRVLACAGAPEARVRGGRLAIRSGDALAYDAPLVQPALAE
jgi:hypothetical protein